MPVRTFVVDYLNARPLWWALRDDPGFELHPADPAGCARALQRGEGDLALLPVAALDEIPAARIVPGWGVACRGAVESVILLSRAPWPEVRRVAMDASSRTSAELARLVLEWRGVEAQLFDLPPDPERMLEEAEACLLIGDPALRAPRSGLEVLDLGEAWFEHTGLPFVFALWVARGDLEPGTWIRALDRAARHGMRIAAELAARDAGAWGVEPDRLVRYIRRRIHHRIGPEEIEGLERFRQLLAAAGRLDAASRLEVLETPGRLGRGGKSGGRAS